MRDKVYGTLADVDDAVLVTAIDFRNRLLGTYFSLRRRLIPQDFPDEVLVERVRARLGRAVSHPGAIHVTASAGAVTLAGPVLKRQRKRALRAAASVPGVHVVVDWLEAHKHKNADGSWHWEVAGPLGATVRWDASVTQLMTNERIAWATRPGSVVQHAGIVRFEPRGPQTRIQVSLSYNPPAGALGHVVASLFGADPKAELDEDMVRMKTMLETGKVPRDAVQPQAV